MSETSVIRQTIDLRSYDRWYCGGRPSGRVLNGVIYCGQWSPVPSMAEGCELEHEEELTSPDDNARSQSTSQHPRQT